MIYDQEAYKPILHYHTYDRNFNRTTHRMPKAMRRHFMKYFIQGWVKDSVHYLVLDYDYETEVYDPNNPECNKYIWEYSSTDSGECVQAFLDAPLWDGKKFFDVEKEITWADP